MGEKLIQARRRTRDLMAHIARLEEERDRLRRENEEQRVAVKVFEHEASSGRELVRGTEAFIEKTKQWMCEKFESASQEAVVRSQRTFFDVAKETFQQYHALIATSVDKKQSELSAVMVPLKASLEQMEKKVHELELSRRGAYDALSTSLQQLSSTQQLLHKETGNLVRALREPTVRGRWGEVQLRRVVEVAGMIPYCDFEEQVSVAGEEGSIRPDMVVKLPNDRLVVIDSKVSLAAYMDALQADSPEVRTEKLVLHARHVRQHVSRLAQKRYWDQFPKAPDFVVLFLHGDCFLAPALEHDPELLEFASGQKVLLATPTSLIAMLKVIAYGWREAKIERHAQTIIDDAKEWLDRCKIFSSHFCDVGRQLERSVKAYNGAVGSFETRLLPSVRRLAASGMDVSELEVPASVQITPMESSLKGTEPSLP